MNTLSTLSLSIFLLASPLVATTKKVTLKAPSKISAAEHRSSSTDRITSEGSPTRDIDTSQSLSVKQRIAALEGRTQKPAEFQRDNKQQEINTAPVKELFAPEVFNPRANITESATAVAEPIAKAPEVLVEAPVAISRIYAPSTKRVILEPMPIHKQLAKPLGERETIAPASMFEYKPVMPKSLEARKPVTETALTVVHPETRIVVPLEKTLSSAKATLGMLAKNTQAKEATYNALKNTIATLQREGKTPTKEQFATLDKTSQELRQTRLVEREQNIAVKEHELEAIQDKINQSDRAQLEKIHAEFMETNAKMRATPLNEKETIEALGASLKMLTAKDLIGKENLARGNLLGAKQELYRGEIGNLTNIFANPRSTKAEKRKAAADLISVMKNAQENQALDLFDRAQMASSPDIQEMLKLSLKTANKQTAQKLLAANQLNKMLDTYDQAAPAERKKLQKTLDAFVTNNLKNGALSSASVAELTKRKTVNKPTIALPNLKLDTPAPSMMSRFANSLSAFGLKLQKAVSTRSTKVSPEDMPVRPGLRRSNAQRLLLTD